MELLFIINFLVIWGLRHCFEENNILGFIRHTTVNILVRWPKSLILGEPLFDCVYCMSSVWSIPFYIYGFVNYDFSLYYWPVWMLCLVGVSRVVYTMKPETINLDIQIKQLKQVRAILDKIREK